MTRKLKVTSLVSPPGTKGGRYATRLGGTKKLIASRMLKAMAWNAPLIKGGLAAELAKTKQPPGGNIAKDRISSLDPTLHTAGPVDECRIWAIPKMVGEGKHVFEDVDHELVRLHGPHPSSMALRCGR